MSPNSQRAARRRGVRAAASQAAPLPNHLQEMIALLRGLVRRAAIQTEDVEDLDDLLKVIATVGRAGSQLAGMLKAAQELEPGEDLAAEINATLAEVIRELGDQPQG